MVLGKLPEPGRPTIWIIVGQGPIALAEGAGGGLFGHFTLLYPFPSFPSLCETARYRLKYCLKGPLNPKQPTIQQTQIQNCLLVLRPGTIIHKKVNSQVITLQNWAQLFKASLA